MAPVGMVGMLGWVSSPELGVISLVVFLVLSVTLLALCIRCQRKTANAYAVNETPTDGKGGANGNTDTRMGDSGTSWRTHQMPASTLERATASTN
ncbi:uncharacterized protein LOC118495919 isoform X4 [Sander lucioperca]|uniref:uncharacterized protein LOC118495919 isoform X4 n=1 Tax=Sander lucioperca TaxID=283035 RepID=UPI0016539041|nr:uncharacterized protein LOC118495919 isoform X4 [Sander lucioperca]XP_035861362.1 uncharacterized protein LOC118495919 isoform X4 [Sander lucioperca]XP_035861363.1 uncharacterized protein LOC118495919 isoform X4 [Sander lucioperca]XP_035861364.1 uncharacterized protein LOC118495919 isoform X4 [Sander lucioperca]